MWLVVWGGCWVTDATSSWRQCDATRRGCPAFVRRPQLEERRIAVQTPAYMIELRREYRSLEQNAIWKLFLPTLFCQYQ